MSVTDSDRRSVLFPDVAGCGQCVADGDGRRNSLRVRVYVQGK